MTEVITKIIVTPEGQKEVPLSAEELAQRELDIAAYEARLSQMQAAAENLALVKESARSKLVAGVPLTVEEAALVIP